MLVRDALYDSLVERRRAIRTPPQSRQRARTPGRPSASSEIAETLAHHFSLFRSSTTRRFTICSLAGRKCLDIYSLEEAESYFDRALNVFDVKLPHCADLQAMATVVANLLEVLYLKGNLSQYCGRSPKNYIPRLQAPWRHAATGFCALFSQHAVGTSLRFPRRRSPRQSGARDCRSASAMSALKRTRDLLCCFARPFSVVTRSKPPRLRAPECSKSVPVPATITFSIGLTGRSPGTMSAAG